MDLYIMLIWLLFVVKHQLEFCIAVQGCGVAESSDYSTFVAGPENDDVKNRIGHWPWMASLGKFNVTDNRWTHYCGATLISDRHFLTAAHCVVDYKLQVRLGHRNISINDDMKVLNILKPDIHPNFTKDVVYFDVAILTTEIVDLQPVCLPHEPSEDPEKYDNNLVHLIGWGSETTNGKSLSNLKRVEMKVFAQRFCNQTHQDNVKDLTLKDIKRKFPDLFQGHVLCAGSELGNIGSCMGDSGGPLMVKTSEEKWVQIATVHGSFGQCGDPRVPGIYVRLDNPHILDFIKSVTFGQQKEQTSQLRGGLFDHENVTHISDDSKVNASLCNNDCTITPRSLTKLAVLTGFNNGKYTSRVFVKDLEEPNKVCKFLPDTPAKAYSVSGILFNDSVPMFCGGFGNDLNNKCECFGYQHSQWMSFTKLPNCRSSSAAAKLIDQDGRKTRFVIAGGWSDTGQLNTVDASDGKSWQSLSNLPSPVSRHCMVTINATTLLSIGGLTGDSRSSKTYFFNSESNQWSLGPDLITPRDDLSCSTVNWKNPSNGQVEKVVVVAGGFNGAVLSSVELLIINNIERGWQDGPELPHKVSESVLVEYKNSVVLVGGFGDDDGKHLYQLKSRVGPWIQMETILPVSKSDHLAILIPDELTDCK